MYMCSGMSGLVFSVPGLLVWMSGRIFWISGLVFWTSGHVFWMSGVVFWMCGQAGRGRVVGRRGVVAKNTTVSFHEWSLEFQDSG